MIYLVAGAVGAALGWRNATKRSGNRLDKMQWAAGYGIAFMTVTLIFGVIFIRTAPPM